MTLTTADIATAQAGVSAPWKVYAAHEHASVKDGGAQSIGTLVAERLVLGKARTVVSNSATQLIALANAVDASL